MKDKFQSILLRAKDDVYTHLQGGNFSKILGQGYDFSELRTYDSTDDIRCISWINSAKSNELHVKKMNEERELLVHVALMLDGRTVINDKQALMTYVLAILAYSTINTNNLFSTSFISASGFKSFESTKNLEAVESILIELNQIEPIGLSPCYDMLQNRLLKMQETKSLFFLVGDFLDEVDLSILAQKHELCVIIIRDRWEENPSTDSSVELINPISNSVIAKVLSKKSLAHYINKLIEHDEKLYAHFNEHQIKYIKVYEPSEVFEKLERLFYF